MADATSDATFQKDVLESDLPTLVDFWAEWCGPCKMLGPVIEEISKEVEGKARVFKMDVEQNPETANKYQIRSIPTVILFRNGKIAQQLVGVRPKAAYLEALQS